MSASVCSPLHIATCADVITHQLTNYELPPVPDIAAILAKENLASVAFRYSPEGVDKYAERMASLVKKYREQGYEVVSAPVADIIELIDYTTTEDYVQACKNTQPLPSVELAEAFQYLTCYRYQSCEHDAWENSFASLLTGNAALQLAKGMAKQLLGDRALWFAQPPKENPSVSNAVN